jgi:L-ribulokinase
MKPNKVNFMAKEEMDEQYVIGVDFGTLSGRALLVRVSDGVEVATAVHSYRNGVLEQNLPDLTTSLPPDWALQVPHDYIEVLQETIPRMLKESGISKDHVIGIATDFTACTVLPTLSDGTPLCELDRFKSRPHAYAKLWKHHAAQKHADRINELAHARGESWINRYGGKISSEWEFAKGLQVLEEDQEIYSTMNHWVEASDWIVWQLCGTYVRNICATGYKAILQDDHYPSREFLKALNPKFEDFVETKVRQKLGQLGDVAGLLTEEAAQWTGLNAGIVVAVGNVDAHVTSAAANATQAGEFVAIMGTSTCHVMVGSELSTVAGMCGVVMGGIVPGKWGYEAGQSGVGDIFAWFTRTFVSSEYEKKAHAAGLDIHDYLAQLAQLNPVGSHGLIALDWQSGNRSTLIDHTLSGLIMGLTLATKPEEIYQALVESTAFGTRKIIEAFTQSGVPVKTFIAAGGLTKSDFVMQIYANILNRPIDVINSEQGSALGSAIHAAVAAGVYKNIEEAASKMGGRQVAKFSPDPTTTLVYDQLYSQYVYLYDLFGTGEKMHELRDIRNAAKVNKNDE